MRDGNVFSRERPSNSSELGFDATSSRFAPTNAYDDLDRDGFPDLITLIVPSESGSLLVEFGPRGSGRTRTLPFHNL